MGERDSMFVWPSDGPKGRHEVAQLLDALRLAPHARGLMAIVFHAIWPEEEPRPAISAKLDLKDDLQAKSGYSKSTISPLLQGLKAAGWIKTSGRGNVYQINWQQLFEIGPVQSVRPSVQPVQSGVVQKLDRSSRSGARTGPIGPETGSGLDRSNSEPEQIGPVQPDDWTDWTGPIHAADSFTPLERLANAAENSLLLQQTISDQLDDLLTAVKKLDQLDRSNQSNWSSSEPLCMSCKNVIHDMSIGDFEEAEKDAGTPDVESPSSPETKPDAKETPMPLDPFKWPDDLYVPGKGLLPATLEMPTGRERLYQHATLAGGWPKDSRGRIEFHATVIYCRRTSDNPGATLTAAVRAKCWGSRAWFSAADLRDATATIGRSTPPPAPIKNPEAAPKRDWTEIDRQIDALDLAAAEALLPDSNSFLQQAWKAARAKGKDPRTVSLLRTALRHSLDPMQKPSAPAAPVCTPGLDLAGLDIE